MTAKPIADDLAWDAAEADAVYSLLGREVIPAFYTRDEHDVPPAWMSRMRESIAHLTPRFSANRAVREYTDAHYVPAAAYLQRAAGVQQTGAELVKWKAQLASCWPRLSIRSIVARRQDDRYVFEVQLFLDELEPDAVRVEVSHLAVNGPPGGGDRVEPCGVILGGVLEQPKAVAGAARCARGPRERPIERRVPPSPALRVRRYRRREEAAQQHGDSDQSQHYADRKHHDRHAHRQADYSDREPDDHGQDSAERTGDRRSKTRECPLKGGHVVLESKNRTSCHVAKTPPSQREPAF